MPDFKDTPKHPAKDDPSADQGDPSISPSVPQTEKEEHHTVELVSFGPIGMGQGVVPPNPEDIALLTRRHRRRWIGGGSAVVLIILGLFFGPSLYRLTKAHIAYTMAKKAEEDIPQKRIDEAIYLVRSAFKMSPDEPEVLRAMAKIISSLDIPGAMVYWNWVLQSKVVTDQDRREAANYALHQSLYNDALGIINALLQKDGNDSRNLILAAQLYSLVGDSPKAMSFATRASLNDPTNKAVLIFLALEELKNPYLHQTGIDSLFKIADGNDPYGLVALQRLVSEPTLKPQEIDRVITRLRAHPMAGEIERLLAFALEIKKNPSQKDDLLKKAMKDHENASVADLREFANWLNTINESARVLTIVSPSKALTDKGLYAACLDAIIATKKWHDLKFILSQSNVPLEPVYQQLYLSRWAAGIGDTQAEELYWKEAEEAAAHNSRQRLALALYAEKWGRNDRADAIYRLLIQDPLVSRLTFTGLLRVNWSKNSATVRDVLDQMVARWPMDVVTMDNDIYFNLLLDTRVQEMLQRETALIKDDPFSLTHRTNLALAYLRLKKPEEALKVYHDVDVQWEKVPTSSLVVYAATLAANARPVRARNIIQLIDLNTLRAEERALIKSSH